MHCVLLTSYFFFEKDSFIQQVKEYYCKQGQSPRVSGRLYQRIQKVTKILPPKEARTNHTASLLKEHLAVGTQKE